MLIAVRRFSSSLPFTHLTRISRPKRRRNASFQAEKATILAEWQSSVSVAKRSARSSREFHVCSSVDQLEESLFLTKEELNNEHSIINSSSRNRNTEGTLESGQVKDEQIVFSKLFSSMNPIVAEYFAEVEKHQVMDVTTGAHPIVEAAFEKVLDVMTSVSDKRLKDMYQWFRKMIEYNVPEGKRNRLVAVMLAYQTLEKREITSEKLEKAAILGWLVELLQAFFLICDDIMDNSLTRRGRRCWYRVEGVNMMAINDAVLCETAIYHLLRTFFRSHPNYVDMLEIFHEVTLQTSSGQSLDMLSERKGGSFNEEIYNAIVQYKTAYYSFSLPIRLGMYLAGISDEASHKKCETLALKIGYVFQVQDDYLDCYGDPNVIGKVGTDITDAKCSWLVVKALQIATPEQKDLLLSYYGKGSPGGPQEAEVKKIYDMLKMDEVFREAEDQAILAIRDDIKKLDQGHTALRSDVFKLLVNKIYRREK